MLSKLALVAIFCILAVSAGPHGGGEKRDRPKSRPACPPEPKDDECSPPAMMGFPGKGHGRDRDDDDDDDDSEKQGKPEKHDRPAKPDMTDRSRDGQGKPDKPGRPHDGHGKPDTKPLGKIWEIPEREQHKLNNGIENATLTIWAMKDALIEVINEDAVVEDCQLEEDDILDIKVRGAQTVVKFDCNATVLYANLTVTTHEVVELEEDDVPELPEEPLPGGFSPNCELGQTVFHFKHYLGRDSRCKLDRTTCLKQSSVYRMNYYCAANCEDGTTKHIMLRPKEEVDIVLNEISSAPSNTCFKRLTTEHLTDLVLNSSNNTFVFLKDHCGFSATTYDELKAPGAMSVAGGTYVELPTGVQYCIKVETPTGESSCLAIYQYSQPATTPFMVAHPFENPDQGGFMACNLFMLKVKNMWGNY